MTGDGAKKRKIKAGSLGITCEKYWVAKPTEYFSTLGGTLVTKLISK